jgi:hypothetical protein
MPGISLDYAASAITSQRHSVFPELKHSVNRHAIRSQRKRVTGLCFMVPLGYRTIITYWV